MFYSASVPFIGVYLFIVCTTSLINALNVTRFGRQAICGEQEFQCKDGQCIENVYLCDGSPQCGDNSDETGEACKTLECPGSTYRCDYGGCVSIKVKCNGVKDCFDGSDEAPCSSGSSVTPTSSIVITSEPPVTPLDPSKSGSCMIPNNPPFGVYKVTNNTTRFGSYVPQFSLLLLDCSRRYKPISPGRNISVCYNGEWTPPPSTCAPSCLSVEPSETTTVTCNFRGMKLESCIDPVEGVEAEIRCAELYEAVGLELNPYRKCKDGSWDNTFPKCTPICGQKRPRVIPQILNGQIVKKADYPWHVGIFTNNEKKDNICGGSVISDNVILSAAHCFSNHSNGQKYPEENYLVAAGKYFTDYSDERDEGAQYSAIRSIHIPVRYKGEISQYEADIAIVILKTKLNFTTSIQPVCIDWTTNFDYRQIFGEKPGVAVGWDQTVDGANLPKELKVLSIPAIPYEQCYEAAPKDFRRFLTHDKICAGYLGTGQSLCQGNDGGGLSFIDNTTGRYFVRGIFSVSPATTERFCDSNQYRTFTLVSKYLDFIRQFL